MTFKDKIDSLFGDLVHQKLEEKKNTAEDSSNDKSDDGEGLDKVDPKAAKKKFKDRKDQDLDNDGDVDDSDKFLHKRRKAIGKAMAKDEKDESVKKPDAVDLSEGDMKSAAKELESYAKRSGGIDKNDFMKAVVLMKKGDAKGLQKFTNDLDTEPRDKIISVVGQHIGNDKAGKLFGVNIREQSESYWDYMGRRLKEEGILEEEKEMTAAQKKSFDKLYKKLDGGPEHRKIRQKIQNPVKADDAFHAMVKKMVMGEGDVEEGKRGFIMAAKTAKEKGEKSFVFAGKTYTVEDTNLDEASKTIDAMKQIVDKKQAMKIDGVMVDMFTASAVTQIYDKVNDANKAKMDKMKATQLASVAMKMLKKEGVENLEEMKNTHALIDTADGNKVVAMASSEQGVKQSKASAERPPMSVKDKNTLKIVKLKKAASQKASERMIGYPLKESADTLDEASWKVTVVKPVNKLKKGASVSVKANNIPQAMTKAAKAFGDSNLTAVPSSHFDFQKEDVTEGFSPKEIKMAIGVASDKRYAGGNMTGAVKAIDKIKKGLSDHPQVAAVLKRQNEDKTECPQCEGEGCDHCDGKGYHEESKKMALAKKLAKVSATSKKGKEKVTLKKAPWDKKETVNTEPELEEAKDYEYKDGKVHISKKAFRKVHKDFKNATRGKERMMILDPKTQASISVPVVFTESSFKEKFRRALAPRLSESTKSEEKSDEVANRYNELKTMPPVELMKLYQKHYDVDASEDLDKVKKMDKNELISKIVEIEFKNQGE